jgi:hypothetical protein
MMCSMWGYRWERTDSIVPARWASLLRQTVMTLKVKGEEEEPPRPTPDIELNLSSGAAIDLLPSRLSGA